MKGSAQILESSNKKLITVKKNRPFNVNNFLQAYEKLETSDAENIVVLKNILIENFAADYISTAIKIRGIFEEDYPEYQVIALMEALKANDRILSLKLSAACLSSPATMVSISNMFALNKTIRMLKLEIFAFKNPSKSLSTNECSAYYNLFKSIESNDTLRKVVFIGRYQHLLSKLMLCLFKNHKSVISLGISYSLEHSDSELTDFIECDRQLKELTVSFHHIPRKYPFKDPLIDEEKYDFGNIISALKTNNSLERLHLLDLKAKQYGGNSHKHAITVSSKTLEKFKDLFKYNHNLVELTDFIKWNSKENDSEQDDFEEEKQLASLTANNELILANLAKTLRALDFTPSKACPSLEHIKAICKLERVGANLFRQDLSKTDELRKYLVHHYDSLLDDGNLELDPQYKGEDGRAAFYREQEALWNKIYRKHKIIFGSEDTNDQSLIKTIENYRNNKVFYTSGICRDTPSFDQHTLDQYVWSIIVSYLRFDSKVFVAATLCRLRILQLWRVMKNLKSKSPALTKMILL